MFQNNPGKGIGSGHVKAVNLSERDKNLSYRQINSSQNGCNQRPIVSTLHTLTATNTFVFNKYNTLTMSIQKNPETKRNALQNKKSD